MIDPDAIPQEMRACSRWGLWRYETRGSKPTKIPFSPVSGHEASSTNPHDWTTFEHACSVLRQRARFDGLGFRLGEPWAGVDLDGCRDPETGDLAPEAAAIIEALDSYTEVSPSGNGVKLFLKGHLPPGRRRTKAPWAPLGGDHADIEMYDMGRYFTVTGEGIWEPGEFADRSQGLQELHQRLYGATALPMSVSERNGRSARPEKAFEDADAKILRVARGASNGAAFSRLFDHGDSSDYGSPSEADAALVAHLAFYCGGDVLRVDNLFRRSGLMRDKWDERHGAQTYGEMTLSKGMSDIRSTYRGRGNVQRG